MVFCEWVDHNVGGCSKYNIDMLFDAFNNPKDIKLQKSVKQLKEKIKELNSLS